MTTLPKPADPANGFTAVYDAWNRLVELKDGANTVAKYKHDGRGRRILKETYTAGTLSETRHFYHSNDWQVLEERVGSATTAERQYVWGARYVDELVCRDRDTNGDGSPDERLYAIQDANFNVTALADTSGAVQERYSYTPYGARSIHDGSFAARTSSSYAWDVGHQGLSHDIESGLVYNRNRVYHPAIGRFMQRDPLGYVDGTSLYEAVGSNPIMITDALGLCFGCSKSICLLSCPAGAAGCAVLCGQVPEPRAKAACQLACIVGSAACIASCYLCTNP
jgi:RHS repeat-associated protein